MSADPFAAVFPGPRGPVVTGRRATPDSPDITTRDEHPAPLSSSQILAWVRKLLPELAREAKSEAARPNPSRAVARRPASWTLAALLHRASGMNSDEAGIDLWCASTDLALWEELGFPRAPGQAEARRYVHAACRNRHLKTRPARALLAVLPDVARGGNLPGEHITADGCRERLTGATPARQRARR